MGISEVFPVTFTSGLTGYIVEVIGYVDATGSAAMNTKLSEDRAKAVVTYLMQQVVCPCDTLWLRALWGNTGLRHRMRQKPDEPRIGESKSRYWSTKASPAAKANLFSDHQWPHCYPGRQ